MAAPFRNKFHPQEHDQNATFRARYHVSTHRNQLPGGEFNSCFRPRFQDQFERPRNRFESPRWQGNNIVPNSFQHPPPNIRQRFIQTTPSTSNSYGAEQPGFAQGTGNLENSPRLPVMGNVAINQYGTGDNGNNAGFQNFGPHNSEIPNFHNPAIQSSQPIPTLSHTLPPPNSMQFSAPPPLAVPPMPPRQCAAHAPSMPPPQCAVPSMPPPPRAAPPPPTFTPDTGPNFIPKKTVDDATAAKQCLDAWLRRRQKGKREQDIADQHVENVSVS